MSVTTDITTRITDHLNEVLCPVPELEHETNLLQTGLVDSLMIMEIVEYLQKTYAVTIEPRDVTPENFHSAQSLSDLVISKLSDGLEAYIADQQTSPHGSTGRDL